MIFDAKYVNNNNKNSPDVYITGFLFADVSIKSKSKMVKNSRELLYTKQNIINNIEFNHVNDK